MNVYMYLYINIIYVCKGMHVCLQLYLYYMHVLYLCYYDVCIYVCMFEGMYVYMYKC